MAEFSTWTEALMRRIAFLPSAAPDAEALRALVFVEMTGPVHF
jgi:hypothetical protein